MHLILRWLHMLCHLRCKHSGFEYQIPSQTMTFETQTLVSESQVIQKSTLVENQTYLFESQIASNMMLFETQTYVFEAQID
jgi:hypothetical protein